MKVTSEIVQLFWEDGHPVGLLHQNGQTTFYRITKANKDFVAQLLEADKKEEIK